MIRRTFLKKAALAAVGAAAYASPLSATPTNSDTRMKVLLINGSPRPDGNTFCALQEIETQLKKQGIETEIFQIGARPVRMCINCGGCRRNGGKGEARLDKEGMQTMRTLGNNMAWLLKRIHAGGDAAPKRDEQPEFMNFIR